MAASTSIYLSISLKNPFKKFTSDLSFEASLALGLKGGWRCAWTRRGAVIWQRRLAQEDRSSAKTCGGHVLRDAGLSGSHVSLGVGVLISTGDMRQVNPKVPSSCAMLDVPTLGPWFCVAVCTGP